MSIMVGYSFCTIEPSEFETKTVNGSTRLNIIEMYNDVVGSEGLNMEIVQHSFLSQNVLLNWWKERKKTPYTKHLTLSLTQQSILESLWYILFPDGNRLAW